MFYVVLFQVIKDRHLFGVVCLLVMIDVIYLTVWQVVDPMRRIVREFSDEVRLEEIPHSYPVTII